MIEGIILKGIGSFYDIAVGNEVVRCRARGRFRRLGITPMVGDRVLILPETATREGSIEEVLPRKNELVRPPVANIDYLAVVIAVKNPEPDFLLADKLMAAAAMKGIQPLLVINKTDLDDEGLVEDVKEAYKSANYPVYAVSGKYGEGIEELSRGLSEGITTLAGQSGVGKSSIINSLHPDCSLEVGSISQRIKRGKHTTRHVELLSLPYGGRIVDTPGFSAMELDGLEPEELMEYYPEFAVHSDHCRFKGCIHYREPGCRIREMVELGLINRGRYERYISLLEDIKENRRGLK